MTQTEVLKLALEALETGKPMFDAYWGSDHFGNAITAIKEALRSSPNGEAQPEQRSNEYLEPDNEFKNFHRSLCKRFGYMHDDKWWKRDLASLEEWIAKQVQPEQEPKCNPHPKAPHGFDRNASHANDRYVCECEGWNAYDAGYEDGVIAGIEASMEQEPEQRSANEHLEPVAWAEFDGEGGYHFRAYEDNEDYAEQWGKRNPNHVGWVKPLYTTPPQRKPLTDEQRKKIVNDNIVQGYHGDYFDARGIIDDVEAAHGITASEAEDSARSKT